MENYFFLDERLGILLPSSDLEWDDLTYETQQDILLTWEKTRGSIPDRIADLEKNINMKQALLSDESNFEKSCILNREISELASIINDLWLWFRTQPGHFRESSFIR